MSEALVPKMLLHFKYYYRHENSGAYLILGADMLQSERHYLFYFFGLQYVGGKEVWQTHLHR